MDTTINNNNNNDNKNKDIIIKNKKQKDKEAKEDQIEETLENASDKVIKESEKEASQLGDSDRE
jgi:flagellar hook-basal body complex protein FliE